MASPLTKASKLVRRSAGVPETRGAPRSRTHQALRRLAGTRELSNLFWLAIGDGSGKVGFFIANLYLARVLHPADYGILVVAQSLIYYAWQASDLGTTLYGIKSKEPAVTRTPTNPLEAY